MRASRHRREVEAARTEFLSSGEIDSEVVDPALLTSWHRSRIAGVDTDHPRIPYDDAIDATSRLARAAAPVLDRMQDQLRDLPVSAVLSDADGRLLERRESEHALARRLDGVHFAPGFSYAESHVGTNGVGTALEDGRAVYLCGAEHFNEPSTAFACAGAPVRNPLTRRFEGLVDLTCLNEDAHPMMRALVQEAALDIERLLLEGGSARQRAVLEEFLATCRRSGGAVLSVSGDTVMTNRRASSLLTTADEEHFRVTAADAIGSDDDTPFKLTLVSGGWAHVLCRPIRIGLDVAGAVFEIQPMDPPRASRSSDRMRPTTLPGLVGRSPGWVDACAHIRSAARRGTALLITGEPGVGKLALARAAQQEHDPGGGLRVIDASADAPAEIRDLLVPGRRFSSTVVLRHLDQLDASTAEELADLTDLVVRHRPGTWVIGTMRADPDTDSPALRPFARAVTVPPLRHRPDDLHELVTALLRRLAPTRDIECGTDVVRVLARNAWPGNVTELEQVLREAIRRRPVGALRPDDLPADRLSLSRRALTPLETLERDAIVRAIADAGGNRKEAAGALGMSRSSLYRKIHSFGITSPEADTA